MIKKLICRYFGHTVRMEDRINAKVGAVVFNEKREIKCRTCGKTLS